MSANNLTVDGQFRYILQWFNEFSELQREDFVPIAAAYIINKTNIYMNGVVNSLQNSGCEDKPMSLFQCRIKLFKEWSPKWPQEMKLKLKEKIMELDSKIGAKLEEELATVQLNGNSIQTNGISGDDKHDEEENNIETVEQVENVENAVNVVNAVNVEHVENAVNVEHVVNAENIENIAEHIEEEPLQNNENDEQNIALE